jgi:hypothetical protein
LECTRHRKRDVQKARDDWLCVYCTHSFTSKLRLTDHRVVGCPCGPVDSAGSRWELPVYPNLKTAKQGKDLKLALQRGDGNVWDTLHDNNIWMELNPELQDPTFPPAGAKVQVRRFMEPTLDRLQASPHKGGGSSQGKHRPQRPPKPRAAPSATTFVDLEDDAGDDPGPPIQQPRKRTLAEMEEGQGVEHSPRQFGRAHKKPNAESSRRGGGAERQTPKPPRTPRPSPGPPPQPLRVTPIQTRNPSPERVAIQAPPTPVPHVPPAAPMPSFTPVTRNETHVPRNEIPVPRNKNSSSELDVAGRLRKDRQAFYLKAANAARANIKMDTPKPPLRPPVQPPGLFHLLPCGLLNFDLECGSFSDFQQEVDNWKNDPTFMDRLCLAYGRFYIPSHQVQPLVCNGRHVFSFCKLSFLIHCCNMSHSGPGYKMAEGKDLLSNSVTLLAAGFMSRNMCKV